MAMADPEDQSEQTAQRPFNLGVFSRQVRPSGLTGAEVIALALTVVWLLGVTVFFFATGGSRSGGGDPLRTVMLLIAIFMPIALIWVATLAANSARVVREESARLQTAIDAMRQTYLAQQQTANTGISPSVERRIERLVVAHERAQSAAPSPVMPVTEKPAQARPVDDQPTLALSEPEPAAPDLDVADFITALNFPETPDDTEGFRALRRAMKDRRAAELIQASEDVLTLLSQEGIYMDDLTPDRARPEIWRRFAEGQRGRPIATLGGIRDRSSLALSATRMRQDPVFRDATHHFLRKFDQVFSAFAETATDQEIAAVSETRTARAFMLLGRVTGIFT